MLLRFEFNNGKVPGMAFVLLDCLQNKDGFSEKSKCIGAAPLLL